MVRLSDSFQIRMTVTEGEIINMFFLRSIVGGLYCFHDNQRQPQSPISLWILASVSNRENVCCRDSRETEQPLRVINETILYKQKLILLPWHKGIMEPLQCNIPSFVNSGISNK